MRMCVCGMNTGVQCTVALVEYVTVSLQWCGGRCRAICDALVPAVGAWQVGAWEGRSGGRGRSLGSHEQVWEWLALRGDYFFRFSKGPDFHDDAECLDELDEEKGEDEDDEEEDDSEVLEDESRVEEVKRFEEVSDERSRLGDPRRRRSN